MECAIAPTGSAYVNIGSPAHQSSLQDTRNDEEGTLRATRVRHRLEAKPGLARCRPYSRLVEFQRLPSRSTCFPPRSVTREWGDT
ncbi:hypothetical protein AVEN_182715-1 [Araneus ventricosus]|uniref:Uncharacterized protein n=1 Tax=Araneus ventricosus TaxID=182803 RepID=A0A4Y2K0U6_ARAVE|nr:hypothetical protein AVEN_182715-1 [Araneus ventricosus]